MYTFPGTLALCHNYVVQQKVHWVRFSSYGKGRNLTGGTVQDPEIRTRRKAGCQPGQQLQALGLGRLKQLVNDKVHCDQTRLIQPLYAANLQRFRRSFITLTFSKGIAQEVGLLKGCIAG